MSRRVRTVEIEGYGPVAITPLTKKQRLQMEEQARGDQVLFRARVVSFGTRNDPRIGPMKTEAVNAEFGDKPEVLEKIADAVLEPSTPA